MNILGIDPSLNGTGIVHLSDKNALVTESEVFTEAAKLKDVERLVYLRNRVIEHCKKEKDTVVFIETAFTMSKGNSGMKLAELAGVLRVAMTDFKIRYYDISPSALKKFITGTGTADKMTVMKSIIKKYGMDFQTQDEYDAFGLATLGRNFLIAKGEITGVQYNWNEPQKEVLKAIFKAEGLKCPKSLSNLTTLLKKARQKHQKKSK